MKGDDNAIYISKVSMRCDGTFIDDITNKSQRLCNTLPLNAVEALREKVYCVRERSWIFIRR